MDGWSNVRPSVHQSKIDCICFSTQFPSEEALSGKNMQSKPFRICKLCEWNHVGVSHECCTCSVLGCLDTMNHSLTYDLSNHLKRPPYDEPSLNLIDWLQQSRYGPLTTFLHHLDTQWCGIRNPFVLYGYHILLWDKLFPIGEASNP